MKFSAVPRRFVLVSLFLIVLGSVWLLGIPKLPPSNDSGFPWLRTASPGEPQGDEEGEGKGGRRASWFYEQRAYPFAIIPRGARDLASRTLEREEQRLRGVRSRGANATLSAAEQAVWVPLGPAPIRSAQTFGFPRWAVSGRVSALVLDPRFNGTSNRIVYAGAAQGGVWRSIDNGANWEPISDDLPSLAIGAIAIDPTNPNVIYAGTGEGNRAADTYYGAGLFKSSDAGVTWTQITGPLSTTEPKLPSFVNATFMRIEIDPTSTSTLYAATNVGLTSGASGGSGVAPIGNRGIWKSTDGGLNWRNISPPDDGLDRSATDVLLDPRDSRRVYSAILNRGIYRSESGGEPGGWTKLNGGLPDPGSDANPAFRRIFLAAGPPLSPSTQTTLYAAFGAGNDDLLGIWRSTDNGATWTKLINPQLLGQANYNLAMAVDRTNANVIYYGTSANALNNGGAFWRSTDGGQTWIDVSQGNGVSGGLHADTHAIVISPADRNVVFTGNDGGIWRSDNVLDNAVAWSNLNDTLNITQFQSIALHPTDSNIVIGGTQDNGTNRFDGDTRWTHIRDGDGGSTLIDQSNPMTMYHTFFNQSNSDGQRPQLGPEVSTNGGNTWTRAGCFNCEPGIDRIQPGDRVGFYAPLALHPGFTGVSGNVIYFGTHRLYRSSNQGVVWKGLGASADGFGADLTKGGTGRLSAIAAFPRLDATTAIPGETVWIGTSDGTVQVSTNAGAIELATFTNVTRAPLPNRFVTDLGVDQTNSRRAVVTYSGFNISSPAAPGHVFLTLDQGATWSDISGNLPDVPVTSVALSSNNTNEIFIGTDLGVFFTADGGAIWARLGNGMPRVATFMVRYHSATNTVVAATHGRGIYRLTMTRALATVSAASFAVSAIASESIVASFGSGLATSTVTANTIPLPLILGGSRVAVRDSAGIERTAPLFFVSAGQINYQIPPGTAQGLATITISTSNGSISQGTVEIGVVAPAFFSANSDGVGAASGFAVRVSAGNVQTQEEIAVRDVNNRFVGKPIDLGPATDQVVLVLFGSGFRFRSSIAGINASLGGVRAEVQFAGAQNNFVGLDQFNLLIPRTLAGQGEVVFSMLVDGKQSNPVKVNIK